MARPHSPLTKSTKYAQKGSCSTVSATSVDGRKRCISFTKAERVPGLWTRLGMLDVLMAIAAGQLTLQFWDYVMASIK